MSILRFFSYLCKHTCVKFLEGEQVDQKVCVCSVLTAVTKGPLKKLYERCATELPSASLFWCGVPSNFPVFAVSLVKKNRSSYKFGVHLNWIKLSIFSCIYKLLAPPLCVKCLFFSHLLARLLGLLLIHFYIKIDLYVHEVLIY